MMVREETVFGPIHSRRLGSSLGINLLPTKGKFCNFDCIYCECGWNKDGRGDKNLPSAQKVHEELRAKLIKLREEGTALDNITFSGDGEPTLNPEFPAIIEDTLLLRDEFYPQAKVSVLSNATRAHIPAIFGALKKVDNPIMKIDAPSNELIALIDNPAPGYDLARVMDALHNFKGDFVLQTMMLRSPSFDSSSPEVLLPWMDIVRELKPRQVMIYTIDRPTPATGLQAFTEAEMRSFVKPLLDEGFNFSIKGYEGVQIKDYYK